jgi:hypothetical protein
MLTKHIQEHEGRRKVTAGEIKHRAEPAPRIDKISDLHVVKSVYYRALKQISTCRVGHAKHAVVYLSVKAKQ